MRVIFLVTLQEMFRKRIFQITVFITLIYLTFYGIALHYAAVGIRRAANPMLKALLVPQLTSAGLYFASLILAFFAITSLVGAVSGEIESGVIHAIVPAPIRRRSIVLGKLAGYGLVLSGYAVLLFAGVIFMVKVMTGAGVGNLAAALGTFVMQPLILAGLALFGSTLLSTTANAVVMLSLYAISLIGGVVEQIGVLTRSAILSNIGILSSLLVPVDVLYRKTISLALESTTNPLAGLVMIGPFGVQSPPSVWMVVYAALYLLVFVAGATAVFARREI